MGFIVTYRFPTFPLPRKSFPFPFPFPRGIPFPSTSLVTPVE